MKKIDYRDSMRKLFEHRTGKTLLGKRKKKWHRNQHSHKTILYDPIRNGIDLKQHAIGCINEPKKTKHLNLEI
jgi:hypothetical protein